MINRRNLIFGVLYVVAACALPIPQSVRAAFSSFAVANPGWANIDGSKNAPAGTPQFPTLLSGYAARPPWSVAGVDYHVGIDRSRYPTNAALKDPAPGGTLAAALSSIGGTLSTNRITFNGSSADNCVIDGYD